MSDDTCPKCGVPGLHYVVEGQIVGSRPHAQKDCDYIAGLRSKLRDMEQVLEIAQAVWDMGGLKVHDSVKHLIPQGTPTPADHQDDESTDHHQETS